MFSIFNKKIDLEAAIQFWDWFVENEQWIIDNFNERGTEIVYEIESQFKLVFRDFKGELEFDFTFFEGRGELYFYDLRNKYLYNGAIVLKDKMPIKISERWTFIISH